MSINANHYVILGNIWRYDEFYDLVERKHGDVDTWRDEVEELYLDSSRGGIHHHNGVCILSDGMDGEYVIAGYVLNKSGECNDLSDHTAQWPGSPVSMWDDIGDNIHKALGFAKDVEIIAVTHYR
jgi:hypothetical protein